MNSLKPKESVSIISIISVSFQHRIEEAGISESFLIRLQKSPFYNLSGNSGNDQFLTPAAN